MIWYNNIIQTNEIILLLIIYKFFFIFNNSIKQIRIIIIHIFSLRFSS